MKRSTSLKTAVLVFALSEKEEAKRKSFLYQSDLHTELNAHALKIAKDSGMDYFHFCENEQVGENFGERFSNAIAAVYRKGYDAVITIGNDSPNLTVAHLKDTVKKLVNNALVLGPTFDGGFYLMGLRREHFKKETFVNFSWNTREIRAEVQQHSIQNGATSVLLDFLFDIDNYVDLKKVYNTLGLAHRVLRSYIQQLLQPFFLLFEEKELYILPISFVQIRTRGSPYLYSL